MKPDERILFKLKTPSVSKHLMTDNLSQDQLTISQSLKLTNAELRANGKDEISRIAFKNRIDALSEYKQLRSRKGVKEANHRLLISKGSFRPDAPLKEVEIDHSKLDVFVCQSDGKRTRPWLTVAIDRHSRVICGIDLSFEAPGSEKLGRFFEHMVCPKATWLGDRNIKTDWKIYGLPELIFTDNGSDFISKSVAEGLRHHLVAHKFRPIASPRYNGTVERFFRTLSEIIHTLPGSTKSNAINGDTARALKNAKLSIEELEKLIVLWITQNYHHTIHRGLRAAPLAVWERAASKDKINLNLPVDLDELFRSFLPFKDRKIQRQGVQIHGLFYTSETLRKANRAGIKRVRVKYSTDDLRSVHLYVDNKYQGPMMSVERYEHPLPLNQLEELKREEKEEYQPFERPPRTSEFDEFYRQIMWGGKKNHKNKAKTRRVGQSFSAQNLKTFWPKK